MFKKRLGQQLCYDMQLENTIFLVATQNKIDFDDQFPDYYKPILVGSESINSNVEYLKDNTGINISEKNANYCEITALYFAWKNLIDYSIIGLNHYRRYFLAKDICRHSLFFKINRNIQVDKLLLDNRLAREVLESHDIILVKPFTYYHSIESVLARIISNEDLVILEKLIRNDYPEYYNEYINFMRYNNKISSCNMFVTSKTIFEPYCEWLFEVLFKYEKLVKLSPYKDSARIFGFISEALLNIYVKKNNLKVKYKSILVIRDEVQNDYFLIYILKILRLNISFFFNKSKKV
jgi:hypothetical protein